MPYKSKSQLAGDPTDFLAAGGLYIEVFHINSRKTVRFKAFMKDYNDVHNVTYDDQNFVGQSEPVKKWKSTVRQIDLSFAVVASGIAEAKQNLSKVSLMTNMLYPEQQKDGDGIITKVGGSPIFKVRFLNLIGAPGVPWGDAWKTGLQGYISNFLYRVDLENGVNFHAPSMRVNANSAGRKIRSSERGAGKNDFHVYPQEINVSFTFYPVYEKSPGWRVEGDRVIFNVNNQDVTNYPYFEETKAGESNVTPGKKGAPAALDPTPFTSIEDGLKQEDIDKVTEYHSPTITATKAALEKARVQNETDAADAEHNARLMEIATGPQSPPNWSALRETGFGDTDTSPIRDVDNPGQAPL